MSLIVLDSSAAIELLESTAAGVRIAERIAETSDSLHAPHLIDLEVASALRKKVRLGAMGEGPATKLLALFQQLQIDRHDHELLMPRIWDLRDCLSCYDASYVALAEALEATLVTCDGRLSRAAPAGTARIEWIHA